MTMACGPAAEARALPLSGAVAGSGQGHAPGEWLGQPGRLACVLRGTFKRVEEQHSSKSGPVGCLADFPDLPEPQGWQPRVL